MSGAEATGGVTRCYRTSTTKTSPAGRRCQHRGCATILSVYNHGSYCDVHQRLRPDVRLPRNRTSVVPVSKHIAFLLAQGMTTGEIATIAGVSDSAVKRAAGRMTSAVMKTTADRIMSVRPGVAAGADDTTVERKIVREHIRALVAAGMTPQEISRRAGVGHSTPSTFLKKDGGPVTRKTAERILAVRPPAVPS